MGFVRLGLLILTLLSAINSFGAEYVPGEVIVKMKEQSEDETHKFVGKASAFHKLSLKRSWKRFNIHQFKVEKGQTVEKAINDLLLDPKVEYAEPNFIFRKQSTGIEGNPLSAQEVQEVVASSYTASGAGHSNFNLTSNDKMSIEDAWDILSDVPSTPVVAVIDSGVDYNHYVFQESEAIWVNLDEVPGNGIDDDGNGYVDDVHGWNFAYNNNDPMDDDNHGTHVAGIVLGMTQDILKANLDKAKIKIMPLKFLDENGVGSTSHAIEAINYAINNGAHVLNNSWGGGSYSQALQDAILKTYNNGVTFVAAAGNASNNNDSAPTYPASYSIPNVLTIAATLDKNIDIDDLAGFSNYGSSSVHVASPGVSILSTLPHDSFGYSSGTSMAAPFVAGLAALMIREKAGINGYQVKNVLLGNSDGVTSLQNKVASRSRINALEAIDFVQNNKIDNYQPDYASRDVAAESAAGGGCGMIAKVLSNHRKGKGPGNTPWGNTALLLAILFAPVMFMNFLKYRHKKAIENRRQYPRYQMDSEVKIDVGGRTLVGNLSSISLGGARIDTEAMLEDGGIITMSIESPDGQQQVQVQGRVVWSEEKKAYGVKFCDTKDDDLATIGGWTKKLSKI